MKYGVTSLRKQFATDDVILDFIFKATHTEECSCGGTYSRITGRKQYQCSKCRFQIAPTAGTIFHKSDTPLTVWFEAILRFSNAKSGYSAKQLQRDLEVTYKTAWRMLKLIREALGQSDDKLSGDVEVDTGFIGGIAKENVRMANKSTVMAAIERKGEMKATVMPDASSEAHEAFLNASVKKNGTRLFTDDARLYRNAAKGYDRHSINHKKAYALGEIHINSVENFWSHVKRSIKGTHKVVSAKYLQTYLDGFVWHANNRDNDSLRFASLLGAVLRGTR